MSSTPWTVPVGLKADPLPWLLEAGQPSVRYWTLVDILKRPGNDPAVQAARLAIPGQPLVQQLFALQQPGGHWGDDATRPYTAEGTLTVLTLLHMHGVAPDERTAAGCEALLRYCQAPTAGFSMTKRLPSGVFPCTTGPHLPMLVYFGLGTDPRLQEAFRFLIEDMSTPDALDCGRYQHRDCLWGAIAALEGLAALQPHLRTEQSSQVVQRLAEALLNAAYDFSGEHKRWLTFGVPRAWDLLRALNALACHGYAQNPRFQPLLDLVLARQDEQGRFLCGLASLTWPIEPRNRPSKWVTLDVLRLLRGAGKILPLLQ